MLKRVLPILISAVLAFGLVLQISALEKSSQTAKEKYAYVGVKKCKMCHSSAKRGNQFKKWKEFKHAKAFLSLKTPKAKELAQKAGLEGNPWESPKCLKCHVTAFEVKPELKKKIKYEDGVQCEACHGPGSGYSKLSIMKDKKKAREAGLKMPSEKDERDPKKRVCTRCHNPHSPTYKEFNFKEFSKKIAHPVPKKKKEKKEGKR
jgi:hypothetical protein